MEFKQITSDGDRELFISAWENAFSRSFARQDYSWIFHERNDVYALFDGSKVAAGYCLLHQRAVLHGGVVEGALCNNVFVVQECQGYNLFVKLGRLVLQQAARQGIAILLGMPNMNSVPGHRRVGWTLLERNYCLEKVMMRPVASADIADGRIQILNRKNYNEYRAGLEEYLRRIAVGRSFSVLKDQDYFRWRFLERPSVDYKIFMFLERGRVSGYIVYKYYGPSKRLHILDVEADHEYIFQEFLHIANGLKEPFHLINVLGSTIYSGYFLNAGFKVSEEYQNLIAFKPQEKDVVSLGNQVNIVFGDNEVF